MSIYSFAFPPVLIARIGLQMQAGYDLYCILHHSLSIFRCLENCMDCRLASTVLHERRDDCPAIRTPDMLQLSEEREKQQHKHNSTCRALLCPAVGRAALLIKCCGRVDLVRSAEPTTAPKMSSLLQSGHAHPSTHSPPGSSFPAVLED